MWKSTNGNNNNNNDNINNNNSKTYVRNQASSTVSKVPQKSFWLSLCSVELQPEGEQL